MPNPHRLAAILHRRAPLSDREIVELVKNRLDEEFARPGFPPPNWRVHERGCVYYFQLSVGYYKRQPVSLDSVDGSVLILVTRDGKVFE